MSRATDLCELYQNAVKMLTQNPQEWIGLLASAAKFYKLSFDKNVLVYMQRPWSGTETGGRADCHNEGLEYQNRPLCQ